MRTVGKILAFCIVIILVMMISGRLAADDWSAVENAMGMKGEMHADGTISFNIPRNLTVTLDGVRLAPGSDLSSDFTFMRSGNGTMMVGEIALTEPEVANVTAKLAKSGIQETALHNHLLRETPHIMWIHVHGSGDPVAMAKTIRDIVSSLGGSASAFGPALSVPALDTASLDAALGASGRRGDGVYAYSIPRNDVIRMNGMALPKEMDISTEVSFQPRNDGNAAAIGEFVLEADEVEPVLHSLTESGIEVTALHSHMITEEPRLFYLHCWSQGNATAIARSMHRALALTNSSIRASA